MHRCFKTAVFEMATRSLTLDASLVDTLEELGKKAGLGYRSKADAVTDAIRNKISDLRNQIKGEQSNDSK